jgi:wyosine [tRNA(Phe)-imidazoG37] synthetase (radical SAM superfamily)
MYHHLFGPVPSRRLGVSLGIDLTPDTSCTFNCVYCECGKTERLTRERREYVPTVDVIRELHAYLSTTPDLDSITFSGSGEPTLHSGIGEIIAFLKDTYPQYRVTVLTNSSLLDREDVRAALHRADLVIPSLDAISEPVFRKVNRPLPGITSASIINGVRVFCAEFTGTVWIEIFIVPGINDTAEELELFKTILQTLRFDRVQVNTLDRPGAVSWITPVPTPRLEAISRFLGQGVELVASRRDPRALPASDALARDLILSTIQVRPCTAEDLALITGLPPSVIETGMQELLGDDLVETQMEERGLFYFARIGRHTAR